MVPEKGRFALLGKIVLCNTLGRHNILVTKTDERSSLNHSIPNDVIYQAHIWIHNNKILKCHFQSGRCQCTFCTSGQADRCHLFYEFQPEAEISDSQLSHLFGIDLNQIIRDEKIKTILS